MLYTPKSRVTLKLGSQLGSSLPHQPAIVSLHSGWYSQLVSASLCHNWVDWMLKSCSHLLEFRQDFCTTKLFAHVNSLYIYLLCLDLTQQHSVWCDHLSIKFSQIRSPKRMADGSWPQLLVNKFIDTCKLQCPLPYQKIYKNISLSGTMNCRKHLQKSHHLAPSKHSWMCGNVSVTSNTVVWISLCKTLCKQLYSWLMGADCKMAICLQCNRYTKR